MWPPFENSILKQINMCRKRFDRNAIASSDGSHVRVIHDRKANATGRTPYLFCGKPVIITGHYVFCNGKYIGRLHIDKEGRKCISSKKNNGFIKTI